MLSVLLDFSLLPPFIFWGFFFIEDSSAMCKHTFFHLCFFFTSSFVFWEYLMLKIKNSDTVLSDTDVVFSN